jgi:acyl phosphate:glycerol-3-phosphate acyltransferase
MSWMHLFAVQANDSSLETVSPAVLIGVAVGGYCIGCVSTGYYLVRARTGQDIRRLGSGSTGARNVSHILGSNGFAFTLGGDLAKGGVAVWLAMALTGNERVALVALMAVVLGHVWPAQLGFHGGKGIATSLAGLLIYNPVFTLIYCLLFGAIFALTRRSVASSLLAYVLLPIGCYLSSKDLAQARDISILAVVVLIAHHRNVAEGINHLLKRRSLQTEAELPVKEI